MRHIRIVAASFLAALKSLSALTPLAGIVVSLTGALPAQAVAAPFFKERVLSTGADGVRSVFATDVDGDGDIDVLFASELEGTIGWYESDGRSPPAFAARVISTDAKGAWSVFAVDMDGDGDTDALSASFIDDKIAWYVNDGESPPSFAERVISYGADGARSVFATDLDGDGDTDVLSASKYNDKIAWYENPGPPSPSPVLFHERVISTTAGRAASVFGTDVDGDGDTDVISASQSPGAIAFKAWFPRASLLPS